MGDGIGDFAFWLAVGLLSLGMTLGPIGRALGRWIESKARFGPAPEWEDRLAEVEAMERRLGEVEERLDFAERMLAQQHARAIEPVDTPPEEIPAAR